MNNFTPEDATSSGLRNRSQTSNGTATTPKPPAPDSDSPENSPSVIGRTSDGKMFKVPHTSDMISSILDPREKKTEWDYCILAVLLIHIVLFFTLNTKSRRYCFLFLFLFWRAGYDIFLGYLLHAQSSRKQLVRWADEYKLFDGEKSKYFSLIKRQLVPKMNSDYNFEAVPIEFNTWLLFRRLVDLILLLDFVAYLLFSISWVHTPVNQSFWMHAIRWTVGGLLSAFNIWVKLDAHRVVRDYAWYWGDFFFLVDQSLTFDGVFEMAPHPMYSVGYAFYYGVSLMAASYTVLFTSLIAHAAQFAFLTLVENPHIDKTYNTSPVTAYNEPKPRGDESSSPYSTKSARRDVIILKNIDPCRAFDFCLLLIIFNTTVVSLLLISTSRYGEIFVLLQAFAWRLFHSLVLGCILVAQSRNKWWIRHFLKHGESPWYAFTQWKKLYNLSLCMTYISFIAACWKMYHLPSDWTYGFTLLRHTAGVLLSSLHIWTALSVYEVIGDFGWFFGDFFVHDNVPGLSYTGIYRYLNNPEKLMGSSAFWGFALISNARSIYLLALLSQIGNLLFIEFVERPHMQALYGDKLRKEAGLTKGLKKEWKKGVPEPMEKRIREVFVRLEKSLQDAKDKLEDSWGHASPKLRRNMSVERMVGDFQKLADQYTQKFTITYDCFVYTSC